MRTNQGTWAADNVRLQRGGTLKQARIVWKTYGTLSPKRDYFIVIPNMLTNGLSSSPSNTPDFPEVTTYDNVMLQRQMLLELFAIDRLKLVYGWSMGAQQAYHWGALFGEAVERIVVNCGSAKTAPHNFVFLEGIRTTLQAAATPQQGLRAMGRIYAGWALSQTFYRREMWRDLGFASLEEFLVRSWEANFLRRDMHDLQAQLFTWQHGDISANDLYRGDLQMALAGIKAKVLLMPSATDLYFQTDDNREELPYLKYGKLAEIPSVWGHRAGNPRDNPEDAAFIDAQVEALLND